MSNFTQPVCGECWMKRNPTRPPVVIKYPDTETCCYCGNETQSGIYIRVDPLTVPYPTEEN